MEIQRDYGILLEANSFTFIIFGLSFSQFFFPKVPVNLIFLMHQFNLPTVFPSHLFTYSALSSEKFIKLYFSDSY